MTRCVRSATARLEILRQEFDLAHGAVGLPQSHRHHQRSCSSLVGLGYPPDELRGSCFFRGIKALFHHLCHVPPPIQLLQILHPVRAENTSSSVLHPSTAHGSAH